MSVNTPKHLVMNSSGGFRNMVSHANNTQSSPRMDVIKSGS